MIYDNSKLPNEPEAKPIVRRKKRRHGPHRLEKFARMVGEAKFPDKYIDMIFHSKLAKRGGPVRRNKEWVKRYPKVPRLRKELHVRNFRGLTIGNHVILFSNEFEPENL